MNLKLINSSQLYKSEYEDGKYYFKKIEKKCRIKELSTKYITHYTTDNGKTQISLDKIESKDFVKEKLSNIIGIQIKVTKIFSKIKT